MTRSRGEHRVAIETMSERKVRFHQSERFTGILVPLFRRRLDQDTRRGFTEMNAALKLLAECNRMGGTNSILYGER